MPIAKIQSQSASTQSDKSLSFPPEETLDPWLPKLLPFSVCRLHNVMIDRRNIKMNIHLQHLQHIVFCVDPVGMGLTVPIRKQISFFVPSSTLRTRLTFYWIFHAHGIIFLSQKTESQAAV